MRPNFLGLRVLVLESRRAREMASLVTTYGGRPIDGAVDARGPARIQHRGAEFADRLVQDEFDLVVLLTGVGTRALIDSWSRCRHQRDTFVAALAAHPDRGSRPEAGGRAAGAEDHAWLIAPEPNTWRELLAALDGRRSELSLQGAACGRAGVWRHPIRRCWPGSSRAWRASSPGCPCISGRCPRIWSRYARRFAPLVARRHRCRDVHDSDASGASAPRGRNRWGWRARLRERLHRAVDGVDWADDSR